MDRQLDIFLSLYVDDFERLFNVEENQRMFAMAQTAGKGEFYGRGTEEDRQESCEGCPLDDCRACTLG